MLAASVLDGKIYVIGGVIGGVGGSGTSIVEEYDPATDTWTRKANMPTSRKALCASAVAGKIYASGGGTGFGNPFSALEAYDPTTDTWTTKADMPIPRYFHSTSAVDDKIYVFGGAVRFPPHTSTSTVEKYDPNPLVVDFNSDSRIDCLDVCEMIQHWGTDNALYDIAPPPFGDGIVDGQDLLVLAEHITDAGATLAGDINYDGLVDFFDLAELARNWLRQQP
jgi:N-acetylneuraminic acid mutarotase